MANNSNNNVKGDAAAAAIAHIEDEIESTKKSCWSCCKRNKKKVMDDVEQKATTVAQTAAANAEKQRGKCALCLGKIFCCRKTQKVRAITERIEDMEAAERSGCCSCLPCRRKPKSDSMAWAEARAENLTGEQTTP